jgi:hypothetical protein
VQAHDEGVGAFLRGVAQGGCPYSERLRHAAWRKGWSEMAARTGARLHFPLGQAENAVKNPMAELRTVIYWLLSSADRELVIDWLMDHLADPPISPATGNRQRGVLSCVQIGES